MAEESTEIVNIVSILENRILTISDCITALYKEGYIPNNKKRYKLMLNNTLLDVFLHSETVEEQMVKFNNLLYKIEIL